MVLRSVHTTCVAGAAMVIAGLRQGVTEVEQVQNIERGYETLVEKFVALGADMYRSEIPESCREQVISNCNEEKRRREHPFAFFAEYKADEQNGSRVYGSACV